MSQKFVVAMMMHETNTFSPLPTPITSFGRAGSLRGPAAIAEAEGTNTSLGGFIAVARDAGAEFTVPMAANAHPSGRVTSAAFEEMAGAIVEAVAKGCDGVMLALHGAMVTDDFDDGEGELLTRIRQVAPDVGRAHPAALGAGLREAHRDHAVVLTAAAARAAGTAGECESCRSDDRDGCD